MYLSLYIYISLYIGNRVINSDVVKEQRERCVYMIYIYIYIYIYVCVFGNA